MLISESDGDLPADHLSVSGKSSGSFGQVGEASVPFAIISLGHRKLEAAAEEGVVSLKL